MIKPPSDTRQIYSVTKLNRLVKTILEGEVGSVWLTAEISNFTAASSGHWYFSLKDPKAQIRCAMFRSANARLNFRPKEGDKVLVRGNLSLYEPRGDYQLIADYIEPDGMGALKAEFERLKLQLNAQGLFDTGRKQPIPEHIKRVGVITSATGAALHDILTVLKRRSPATEVVVYPSQVQGDSASTQLINAVQIANQRAEVDVIILGRGGGSIEDLWCFNNEALAHAIAASSIPIISAVGHEVDVTIADFVADLRAPTPSAAAEVVSQDNRAQLQQLHSTLRHMQQLMMRQLSNARYRLDMMTKNVQRHHPTTKLNTQAQRLDDLSRRLHIAQQHRIARLNARLDATASRLNGQNPKGRIRNQQDKCQLLAKRLNTALNQQLQNRQHQFAQSVSLLNSLSPLATLSRGYSVTYHNGAILQNSKDVKQGDALETVLDQGRIKSTVVRTE